MNGKRKTSAFRSTSVNLAQKIRAKRSRTNQSDFHFVDRVETETASTSFRAEDTLSDEFLKNSAAHEFLPHIPGSFPVDDNRGGSSFIHEDLPPSTTISSGVVDGNGKETQHGKQRRTVRSRYPNIEWKTKYRAPFLDQLMRGKGRADARKQTHCSDCKGERLEDEAEGLERDRTPVYRCRECFLQDLTCGKCCVRRHWNTPFHRIEQWTGSMFKSCSLASLGLVVQLQHTSGFCTHPKEAYRHLLIIHSNGIHRVKIQFCACSKAREQHIQLLQRRLYPTNVRKGRISTAITFECLELLQLQTLTTKGSVYDFYRALERLSDNTGVTRPSSRYRQLLRGIRQWRHLKFLMRAVMDE
ncbi:hypothetical protein V5O48_018435 [Marasmius crinis-equi]|uniref:CxC2-like cysteine cluster KDZ transposase-associated domain-containing protein n=1 Tax=Marasmius crinis-equi TaxID=585013 RepID=A0ABR3ELA0_9AGAR